ncbi:MAG: TonB-dependent receptor domain-containing protein, partial [Acidimicrobiales bacterium]
LRNDGSSAWSRNDQRHWFPKLSAAWIFTTALADRTPDFLSFGKLRLAYGQAGQEPQPYQTLSTYSTAFLSDGGWGPSVNPGQGGAGGLYSGPIRGQDDLKPERTREVEGGVDLGLWRERADLSLTRYDSKSTDVIFLAPLAPSTGFSFQAQNAATITNKGWEVVLNLRPVSTPTVSWEVGLQWATNDNRVVDLQGADFVNVDGGFDSPRGAAVKGSRVGVLRGFDFARCGRGVVDAVEGDIDAQCGNARDGALYIDPSGFPIFDPTVRVIADPHPDWTGNVRTALRYKKWQLSGLLDIKHGGDVWNGTRGALRFFGTHKDTEIRGQTRTFGDDYLHGAVAGPGAGTPVVIDQTWFRGLGSFFSGGPDAMDVEDGGYVKLREISVGYTLDGQWVREKIGLSS